MALERWIFDGWELTEGTARGWEYRAGTDVAAGLEGSDVRIPGRDGTLWHSRTLAPGQFDLNIWLRGTSPNSLRSQWNDLLRVMVRRKRTINVERHLPSGEVIVCKASLTGSIAPAHVGQLGARCTLTFTVPAGKWLSERHFSTTSTQGTAHTRTVTMSNLGPSTAPMELEFFLYGPFSEAKVQDFSDRGDGAVGEWFNYAASVPTGQGVRVNAATWDVWGIGGYSPNKSALTYDGGAYLTVEPALPGDDPQVRMVATNTGAATKIRVEGKRAYLM